jgi:hypothetical protein
MPYEKVPSSGALLPASLMYFCSGEPMHFYSGVDKPKILTQQTSPARIKRRTGNRSQVFDLDQTVPLPILCILREWVS